MLVGTLAVCFVVVISTQVAVGATVPSSVAGDDPHTGTEAADSEGLSELLGETNASHGLTVDVDYDADSSANTYELDYDATGYRTDAASLSPGDESIVSPESAVDTLSTHADDISPPVVLTLLGYSRYDSSDPLDHEIRARLYEQIQSDAGTTLAELTSVTDVSESTVRYHTRILDEESLVEKEDLWGNIRLFPASYSKEQKALTVALDEPALRNVLSAIEGLDPATVSTVAAEIDRAPSTVSHHLSRLETADLVDRDRNGKRVVTTLKPTVRRALTAGTVPTDTQSPVVSD